MLKLIYRAILIAQYSWVMLPGLAQMFQKGFFWGMGGAKQEGRRGGKEPLLSGRPPLLTTVKNIMYTTNLRPAHRNGHISAPNPPNTDGLGFREN